MKKFKLMFAALLVAVVSVLAVSCSKSDENTTRNEEALAKSTYVVKGKCSDGGLTTEQLELINSKLEDLEIKDATLVDAKQKFYEYYQAMQKEFAKLEGTLPGDLTVTMTLYDSKNSYVDSKDFKIKGSN